MYNTNLTLAELFTFIRNQVIFYGTAYPDGAAVSSAMVSDFERLAKIIDTNTPTSRFFFIGPMVYEVTNGPGKLPCEFTRFFEEAGLSFSVHKIEYDGARFNIVHHYSTES